MLLFLTLTSNAMDSDTAMNTVRITNNDGNSDTVNCEDEEAVGVGEDDEVGETVGDAVGDDGLEVDDAGLGLGVDVELGAKVAEIDVAPLTY